MSGKGDTPRPFAVDAETFDSNWEAIFGKKQVGLGRVVQASGSNPDNVGSIPTAPAIIRVDGDYNVYCTGRAHFWAKPDFCERAGVGLARGAAKVRLCDCIPTYIDPVSGAQVDENWWPGDPVGYEVS